MILKNIKVVDVKCIDFKGLFYIALVFILSACSSFVIPDVDLADENYPTKFSIPKYEIFSKKPNAEIEKIKFIVIVNQSSEWKGMRKKTDHFMQISLLKMGFKKVLTEAEFLSVLNKNNLHTNVIDIYSRKSLSRINSQLGPFLLMVAEFGIDGHGKFKIRIYDPQAEGDVFKVNTSTFVFSYDDQVLYPTINAINDWYRSSLTR